MFNDPQPRNTNYLVTFCTGPFHAVGFEITTCNCPKSRPLHLDMTLWQGDLDRDGWLDVMRHRRFQAWQRKKLLEEQIQVEAMEAIWGTQSPEPMLEPKPTLEERREIWRRAPKHLRGKYPQP